MPHITLEYTANLSSLDVGQALRRLNLQLMESAHFDARDIKSRAIPLDSFLVGDCNSMTGFIHVTLRLLEGRTPQVRRMLAQSLLDALQPVVSSNVTHAIQLTVEVCEIERDSYAKLSSNA